MLFAPSILHKPNINIGNKIVKKIYFNDSLTDIVNYCQSFVPYGGGMNANAWSVGVKAFNNYYFFPGIDATNIYVKSSNLQHWIEQKFIFENDSRQWAINMFDALSAQDKIVGVGYSLLNGNYTYKPNYCFYTTSGNVWLTAQMPSSQRWSEIAYGNDIFVAIAGRSAQFPEDATNIAAYSTNGISWQMTTLPLTANWQRLTYADGKFIALPSTVINSNGTLISALSGAYSTNGISWSAVEIIKPQDVLSPSVTSNRWDWTPIYYFKNKFFSANSRVGYLKYVYSNDGIEWNVGSFDQPWGAITPPLSSFTNAVWTRDMQEIEDTLIFRIYTETGSNIVYRSTNVNTWVKSKDSLQAAISYAYSDNNKHLLFEASPFAKSWRTWIINSPVQNFTTYSTSFIPLNVSVNNSKYAFDQIGSNNPSLTCYREANYDFIITETAVGHPFALRTSLGNTHTQVAGAYNNNPLSGINNNRIMFTPNNDTPNEIYYQSTVHPSMSGIIHIKTEYV